AFSVTAAIFGGMTLMACTFLVENTGNASTPAFWLMLAAVCSLIASLYLCRGSKQKDPDTIAEPAKVSA
ncbi:citrate-proton symporter, partial [Acinetobacter pittii]|nr:citrate-proton symporter [Acinetobacter pittii]